jgi:S-DNA-T family DNA segregation ATPase FtsK/SpoIIIE
VRLRVTVEGLTAGRRTEVTLVAEPDAPAAEVVSAIGRAAGTTQTLWDDRQEVPTDGPLARTGLHDGAVLGAGARGRPVRDPVAQGIELRVVGGPAAGLVFRLGGGRVLLGRHHRCAVPIPDPEMSREHAALDVSLDGTMTICDLGSSNGTSLEGAAVGAEPVPLASGQVVQVGASYVSVRPVDPLDGDLSDDGSCGYVFNRRYRIRRPPPAVEIEFPEAKPEEEKPSFPWLMMGAPLVVAVGMAAVLRQPEYLLLAVMSPVMTLGSSVHDRQGRKRRRSQAATEFKERSVEADRQARVAVQEERARRRDESPDPAVLVLAAMGPRGRLWERRATDDDRLAVRIGLATQPSVVQMRNHPSPPPAWAVPVVVALPAVGVLGVAGERAVSRAVARAVVLQAAVLHSPEDVRVVVLTDGSAEPEWGWVRWLPHAQLDPARGLVALGNDSETLATRVKELQRAIAGRAASRPSPGVASGPSSPDVLVVVDGAKRLRSLPGMLAVLREGPAVGVYSVCLDEDRSLLPEESGAVVTWNEDAGTATVEQHGLPAVAGVSPDRPAPHLCESAARAMAPIHRIGDDVGGGVPDAARLAELSGLDPPTPAAIGERWAAPGRGPRALLGMAEHGPLVLDLATDGPHGLVAGTTGAGKSELLQTLVAGLATSSPPDELNVVLVDYKGGAAFRDCRALPHTVGLVTDLDAHLTERALRSLQAELKRREHLLAVVGAKDIGDYVDARARGRAELAPLPRLVIVMDEFASLALELPDFIKGIVGIAQRGRSLGVHLVLATQRPTGVVSPEIRANANFAVALRVVNSSESSDVIGTPDAATISTATPGRAYLRISQEPPICFQTGRVGGRRPGTVDTVATVTAFCAPWTGLGTPDPAVPSPPAPADDATDLHDLVVAINEAAEAQGFPAQRQPWLDPLPPVLTLAQLASGPAGSALVGPPCEGPLGDHPPVEVPRVTDPGPDGARPDVPALPFGLYDLPDQQEQRPACFDPAAGRHLLLSGSPRSGRSSTLRSVAAAVAGACEVDDVHLYALDCGNGALLPLRDLPQCGAVVTRNEADRTERLLGRLADEVRRRQSVLVDRGLASAAEQRAHPASDVRWPYLVVLVDGWEGFLDAFHDHKDGTVEQLLLGVLRDGGPAGLTVLMTGDRSLLSTARVSSLFEDRFALRFNDRDDYSLAGLAPRRMPETVPAGRAFRAVTGDELQVALLTEDPSGPAQASAFAALAARARERASAASPRSRPFRVDPLPSRISLHEAESLGSAADSGGGTPKRSALAILAGVGGDELAPWWVDLAEYGPGFVVTGTPESGRSTALLSIGTTLLAQGSHVLAVTPRQSPLRTLASQAGAVVMEEAAARAPGTDGPVALDALVAVGGGDAERRVVVLVDDAELTDPDDAWLTALASGPPGRCALVVAGALEQLRDGFRGFPLYAKRGGNGLLLSPKTHLDAAVFNGSLPRGAGFTGQPGRGYLFLRSRPVALLQVPEP